MGSVLSHLVETEAQVGLARELGRSKSLDTGVIDQLERVQCLLQVLNKLSLKLKSLPLKSVYIIFSGYWQLCGHPHVKCAASTPETDRV